MADMDLSEAEGWWPYWETNGSLAANDGAAEERAAATALHAEYDRRGAALVERDAEVERLRAGRDIEQQMLRNAAVEIERLRAVPPPYVELISLLDELPALANEQRRQERLSVRAAAEQIGCSFATLDRWERGKTGRSVALVKALLLWLDQTGRAPAKRPGCDGDAS